jgi:hypothetical protein
MTESFDYDACVLGLCPWPTSCQDEKAKIKGKAGWSNQDLIEQLSRLSISTRGVLQETGIAPIGVRPDIGHSHDFNQAIKLYCDRMFGPDERACDLYIDSLRLLRDQYLKSKDLLKADDDGEILYTFVEAAFFYMVQLECIRSKVTHNQQDVEDEIHEVRKTALHFIEKHRR